MTVSNSVPRFADRAKQASPVLVACLMFAALGCGDGRPMRVPVAGKVLIDGQPVTIGAVRFKPSEGRLATGEIQPDGSFRLTTFEDGDGALTGEHVVTVIAREELDPTKIRWHAPKKYQNPATSGLVQTISEPTDSLEIRLEWDAGQSGPFVETLCGGE